MAMRTLDGIAANSALTVAQAPSTAMAMTYLAMARSISAAMGNAVAAQQRGQLIGESATVKVVEFVLEQGA